MIELSLVEDVGAAVVYVVIADGIRIPVVEVVFEERLRPRPAQPRRQAPIRLAIAGGVRHKVRHLMRADTRLRQRGVHGFGRTQNPGWSFDDHTQFDTLARWQRLQAPPADRRPQIAA